MSDLAQHPRGTFHTNMALEQTTAVVTGVSGFVGHFLIEAMLESGSFGRILGVTRQSGLAMPPGVTALNADLAAGGLPDMPADVLIHVAGEKRDEARMRDGNVVATRRLLEWATRNGVRKVVYVSSVGVYGARPDSGTITEASPHLPANLYEATKAEAEAFVAEYCASHDLDCAIIQPSNVIGVGPRGERPLLGFLQRTVAGKVPKFGGREANLNYVAVEDVAAAICRAALAPTHADTFIINRTATLGSVIAAVQDALGADRRSLHLPYHAACVLAVLGDGAKSLGLSRVPFDKARLRELTNTTVYDGSSIERRLSFSYRFGVEQAVSRLALAYRKQGLL